MPMTGVKICGISTFEIYRHCAELEVDWIGMVFYPQSPRHLELKQAKMLADQADKMIELSKRPGRVALVVDASDDELAAIIAHARPDMIQLHGSEDLSRMAHIKERFGLPVMPVIKVCNHKDIEKANKLADVADWILFDAAPKDPENSLPGGTGESFDWHYLADAVIKQPWMLAGGLQPDTVQRAISVTGACHVDVSSGVEKNKGEKSKSAITAFVHAAKLS